ncbi:MAG: hypothetical protein DWH78_07445 [Planctomycetota bacterium]|nr:MAG: hypothetical protein DWH78_07445 [Planctomycetota bacterium]
MTSVDAAGTFASEFATARVVIFRHSAIRSGADRHLHNMSLPTHQHQPLDQIARSRRGGR